MLSGKCRPFCLSLNVLNYLQAVQKELYPGHSWHLEQPWWLMRPRPHHWSRTQTGQYHCKQTDSHVKIIHVYGENLHDDIIKWKHFPHYWPFVKGIHWSMVDSPHKSQWCRALIVFFDLHLNKRFEQTIEMLVIWDAIVLIMTSHFTFYIIFNLLQNSDDRQSEVQRLIYVIVAVAINYRYSRYKSIWPF